MSELVAGGQHINTKKLTAIGVLVSLGIVFGDIGTSPPVSYTHLDVYKRQVLP